MDHNKRDKQGEKVFQHNRIIVLSEKSLSVFGERENTDKLSVKNTGLQV